MLEIETKTGTVSLSSRGDFYCEEPASQVITEWTYLVSRNSLFVKWGEKEYLYRGVPFSTIHAMMNAESLGQFLNAEVKPNYKGELFSDIERRLRARK